MSDLKRVLVTGDFVLDFHIYEGKRLQFGDRRNPGVHVVQQLGGAALIHSLLSRLGGVQSYLPVVTEPDDPQATDFGVEQPVPPHLKAYSVWKSAAVGGSRSAEKVWLVKEAMGFGEIQESKTDFVWPIHPDQPLPDVLVISDGGMGFREQRNDLWPTDRQFDSARWIVLKTTTPLMQGALWEALHQKDRATKLVVIVSVADLRRSDEPIHEGLSWDSTIETTLAALERSRSLAGLTDCRHLVVAFGCEAGLWLDMPLGSKTKTAHFVFDAGGIEGDHRAPGRENGLGALSCLAAGIAWQLARRTGFDAAEFETALEGGLSAMSELLETGHGPATWPGKGFPAKQLARSIQDATCRFSRAVFPTAHCLDQIPCAERPRAESNRNCWSLVQESLRQLGHPCPEPAHVLADLVVTRGPVALGSLPHLAIGKLRSVDRREIEALRVLQRSIREYCDRDPKDCRRPLSIGVFGPPGAGKSFAVKQLAYSLLGRDGWLEFNLAQFKPGTDDLIGAFHQIRDRALTGVTPVAFFDEFDSRNYQWLQYLLAPMQDGAFQVGEITHPIGKCVLIFAGSTSSRYEDFGQDSDLDHFRMSKGPDFKSRLDGFLNLLGPNQSLIREDADSEDAANDSVRPTRLHPCDIFFPVRRAFILRGELGCGEADKISIRPAVLHALLTVGKYKFGARSLAKVLEPIKRAYPGTIFPSHLPPPHQLNLHVDANEFASRCEHGEQLADQPVELSESDYETIARSIHAVWRELGRDQGWLDKKDDVDFEQLAPFFQESNRASAGRIAPVLALIGLTLARGANTDQEREQLRLRLEHYLELLAECEHAGWMEWYLDQGWVFGPKKESRLTEEPRVKTHPCLRSYFELKDADRNKDRNQVRHYLDFAKNAGMKLVAIPSAGDEGTSS